MDQTFLDKLRNLVVGKTHPIPAWLEDMLASGPRLEEWSPVPHRPNRVLITEFLLRWLKYAGVSEEESLAWLLPYCSEVLAEYSKSGPSMIRHGTKANTRWVYKSSLRFDFEAMANEPTPAEFVGKPAWMPMVQRWEKMNWDEKDRIRKEYVPPVFPPFLPVKKRFEEKFNKAMDVARQKRTEGFGLEEIASLLNEQGLTSRTGRKWTGSMVHQWLRKTHVDQVPGPESSSPEPNG